jgi:hypothetical protein
MATPLAKKLLIKPGFALLVLNPPAGYLDQLAPLPDGAAFAPRSDGTYDCVQLFVRDRAELERHAQQAVDSLRPDGLLWISFPKGSSKQQRDLTRDTGWDSIRALGFQGVSLIAVDDTWSAMRFRPVKE